MRPSRTGDTEFFSNKLGQNVFCDSGLETTFAAALDGLPEVLYYWEQPTPISYRFGGEPHNYHPDFLVTFMDKRSAIIEIKLHGYELARDRNLAKWAATIRYCKSAGRGFFVGNERVSLADALQWPATAEIDGDFLPDLGSSLSWGDLKNLQARMGKSNTEMTVALLKRGLIQDASTREFRWAIGPEQADLAEMMDFLGSAGGSRSIRQMSRSRSVAAAAPSNVSLSVAMDERVGKVWTAEEEDRLFQLHRSGETVEGIAAQLGRRPRGVRIRLKRLGYRA